MKSFRICMQNIRKWGSNSRIKMCLIMSFLFVYSYISGMWKIIPLVGEKMNPWIFSFLFCWRFMKIVFMAPIVFIFCDAPFIDSNQSYVMLRTSRKKWCFGQVLYIYAGSVIYAFVLFFSTIIINIGHIKWGTSWGKVLGSAGTSTVLSTLGINYTTVKVPTIVIRYYTPAQAMFFSFLLMVLSFIFIGLLIYTVNVITKTNVAGTIIAGFFVILTAVVDGNQRLIWFSPISWNSLNNIDVAGMTANPSIGYVLGMYVLLIAVLTFLAVFFGRKQEIIVRNEH